MKKIKVLFAFACIALMATISPLASLAEEVAIGIDVAPNVINIGSSSTWVTVHADIAFTDVDESTTSIKLTVEGGIFPNVSCFADDRGNLVAKFDMVAVKDRFGTDSFDDDFSFVLSGETNSGDNFSGEQYIGVFFDKSKQSGGKT